MTRLAVQTDVLRVYIDAVRKVFAPTLETGGTPAEAVKLLLSLADATVECADNIARTQAQIEELSRMLGVEGQPPPKLRVIDGGQR